MAIIRSQLKNKKGNLFSPQRFEPATVSQWDTNDLCWPQAIIKQFLFCFAATFNWTLCFVVAQGFGPLSQAVGTAPVFWGFGSILVAVFILCLIFVPETKGRSLDEIQEMFRQSSADVLLDDEQNIINNAVDDLEDEIQRESNIVSA